jgi:hypothetical protein
MISLVCRPLDDKGDLAVHLVEGQGTVLVYIGIAADDFDAPDASDGFRRCSHRIAYGIAERVRGAAHDLGDSDDGTWDVILLLSHFSSFCRDERDSAEGRARSYIANGLSCHVPSGSPGNDPAKALSAAVDLFGCWASPGRL